MFILRISFRLLFKLPFFKKYHFGIYQKIFKPLHLFKGENVICKYGNNLKINVLLDDWIQHQIYFLGEYDARGINYLRKNLNAGDVFIDIGANIGCYSLIASELIGNTGQVYAFEPVSNVHQQLKSNIELNHICNINVCKKAIYETSGELKLFVSSSENLGMSSIIRHDSESGIIETVESISLDDFIDSQNISSVQYIKIDIEGAEMYALRGMMKTLERFKPIILMEISNNVLSNSSFTSNDIFTFMKMVHYTPMRIDKNGNTQEIDEAINDGYDNFIFTPYL